MTNGFDRSSKEPLEPTVPVPDCRRLSRLIACSTEEGSTEWSHLLDHLFDRFGESIALLDPELRVRATNQAWETMERRVGSKASGSFLEDWYEPMARSGVGRVVFEKGLRAVLEGKQPEYRHEVALGEGTERRVVELSVVPVAVLNGCYGMVIAREVTRRHQLESECRESHNLFRQVIENISNGVFLYDTEGRFAMVNPLFADLLGFTPHELVGRTIFEVYKPEMAQTVQEQNLLVLTTGQTLSFELMLETPRGLRRVHVSKSVYRNHRGEVVGVLGIGRDITDRRQVTETLEKSERHFRALIENGGDRVGLLDENGTVIYASPSTKRLLGYEIEELIGTDAFLWVHPQDRPSARRRFGELRENPEQVVSAQYRVLHKGGEWRWMEATATNHLNDPAIRAVVLNERDITSRKKAEAELVRFSQIIESSNDAIIATDMEGTITNWNPAAMRIFGYSREEVIGMDTSALVSANGRRQHLQLRQAALRGEGVADYELQMMHKSGRRVSVALSISPLRNESRVITGCAKIIRDITERRRLEREILEISDREKQRLGQDLHDDLCQHLVGISLISNILAEQLEKQAQPQAGEARNIADLACHAVDHARSLARGLSPLRLEEDGLIAQMALLVSVTERLFRIPCSFESDVDLRVKNLVAATHFCRIMQEALHNAVKHSQATQVTVHITCEGSNVILTVADNGVGMGNAVTERSDPDDNLGGLGMHTMQYRARVLGAALEFKEPPGGGTLVSCTVPKRKLGC